MTSENNTLIVNLDTLNSSATAKFGGKAANLGELINSGINVPEGFAISTDLYFDFLKKSNLKNKISNLIENSNSLKINELQKLSNEKDIKNIAEKIKQTAEKGMLATKDLIATKGRASFLGERAKGHIDPGARSSQLAIEAICDTIINA